MKKVIVITLDDNGNYLFKNYNANRFETLGLLHEAIGQMTAIYHAQIVNKVMMDGFKTKPPTQGGK
jgi:hypothetical protein